MRILILATLTFLLAVASHAEVVRLAPDFTYPGVGSSAKTLRSLRGQSVVLIIAHSPKDKEFRREVAYLHDIYQEFAAKQTVFIAALMEGEGPVKSDIPFAIANNPQAVANAYGATGKFNIVIIGRDGNVDYQTTKVLPPERVRDVIQNAYPVQVTARKQ